MVSTVVVHPIVSLLVRPFTKVVNGSSCIVTVDDVTLLFHCNKTQHVITKEILKVTEERKISNASIFREIRTDFLSISNTLTVTTSMSADNVSCL